MVEPWTDIYEPEERVEIIAEIHPDGPQSAEYIAEQAEVTNDIARAHLGRLVEQGKLVRTDDGRYRRNRIRAIIDEVKFLIFGDRGRAESDGG